MFSELERDGKNVKISKKKTFSPDGIFKKETIVSVFTFAYQMTFGGKGEHRDHRTGGKHRRQNGEIFANTFQGKLAECAASNLFCSIFGIIILPDFSVHGLSVWDSQDLLVNGKKISIKSSKNYGNLLLLETNDFDQSGRYLPTYNKGVESGKNDSGIYDFIIMIRIDPSCEKLFKESRIFYEDDIIADELRRLYNQMCNMTWSYEYTGFITLEDLKELISSGKNVIHQGDILNGTIFDADNYYIQAGDLRECKELENYLFDLRNNK